MELRRRLTGVAKSISFLPMRIHTALNLDYRPAAVNVQQFSTTFTYVPNGRNISFILSNNTNYSAARTRKALRRVLVAKVRSSRDTPMESAK